MAASACAIQGIYDIICRDPETASGGIEPGNVELHAPGFYRHDREELEFLTGNSIDRKVQIMADGTRSWIPLANPVLGFRMRTFIATIRIGYFVGDHGPESMTIMADDDAKILNAISRQSNWPTCSSGCINGIVPMGSNRVRVDATRHIWEIPVLVTVTG